MRLNRELGFWDVFCIAAGAMISSGLFILPGLAYGIAGPAVVLSYALASLLVIPAMFAQAELATAMPKSGGSYFFIIRSMGAFPGVLAGLANWFSIALKAAFALIGIGAMFNLVVPNTPPATIKIIALAGCGVFTVLNIVSVKMTGRSQIWMVIGLLAVLVLFVLAGVPHARHPHFAGFLGKGPVNILYVSGLVFVSYGGLTKVASVAEEVRHPGRNIPGGMFAAFVVVALLYVAAVFVVVGLLESAEMFTEDAAGPRANLTPLSSAAAKLPGWQGSVGLVVLAIAGCLAFFTTANGGILSASRIPMAMARDALLPRTFGRVSKKLKTPVVGILFTSGFMAVVIALLDVPLLAKVASTMMLMLFLLVNLAVLILRTSKIQNYRPLFKAPLYPWLQVISLPLYILLIAGMGWLPLAVTGGFFLLGALWYFVYARHRIQTESALLYMVRNALSKVMYRSELESELRQIALERDDVIHDRFDELIKNCDILDIEDAQTRDEVFRRISEVVGRRLDLPAQRIFEEFQDREKQSSTVIQEGLAIPHIVLEGHDLFEMVVARCRGGAVFPNQQMPVYTIFALVGSSDQRNYHLQALMAIAHIVQEHGFDSRWRKARGEEDLRDVLLLSSRKRHQAGA